MSAPGRRMDSTKHFGMDAWRLVRVSIARGDSHWPHGAGPGPELRRRRKSHETLLRANGGRAGARIRFVFAFSFYVACLSCVQCQCRSRFQQISASFRATATRAIFALERFRTRV